MPNNKLKRLPESIGELQNLQSLVLNNNEIKELPETIANAARLSEINVSSNSILLYLN